MLRPSLSSPYSREAGYSITYCHIFLLETVVTTEIRPERFDFILIRSVIIAGSQPRRKQYPEGLFRGAIHKTPEELRDDPGVSQTILSRRAACLAGPASARLALILIVSGNR